MNMHRDAPSLAQDKKPLEKRLEELGWAVFLVMTGVIWLMPADRVPQGSWLIGTGVLLLALNVVRYFNGVRISGFTSALGAIALAGGLGEFFGVEFPLLALALILFGVSVAIRPFVTGRK